MSHKIWQQCGHNTNWNINSFTEDLVSDGLILSPVHQTIEQITSLDPKLKQTSLFDPQFYLPNSQKLKLKSYAFFPESIANGFATEDFSMHSLDAARRCVNFQIEQNFQNLIVPARFFDDMISDYTEKQNKYTVEPFLKVISEISIEKAVYLTLPLTSGMIKDKTYRTKLLNWVTNYPEIDGIYLIVSYDTTSKQINDKDFLINYLTFVKELIDSDLQVLVGYLNTESVLFTLIESCQVSIGSFENTRKFSLDKFIVSDEIRMGPKSRVYLPGLFQWVLWDHARTIKDEAPDLWEDIYIQTKHGDDILSQIREPHFNQPGQYMHHFMSITQQIKDLSSMKLESRYETLRQKILNAIEYNQQISAARIDLDIYGKGEHLQSWLDAINSFARKYIN